MPAVASTSCAEAKEGSSAELIPFSMKPRRVLLGRPSRAQDSARRLQLLCNKTCAVVFLDLCPALLPPPPPRKNIPHNITKKLEVHFPDGHLMARTHSPFPLPPRVKPIFIALGRPLLEGNQSGEFSLLRSSTDEIANRAQEALCHQFNDERVSTQTWCHASEDVVEVGAREKVSLSRAHTHTLSLSLSLVAQGSQQRSAT